MPRTSPAMAWLAVGALVFLGASIVWSGIHERGKAAELAELQTEWAIVHPEYIRLSRAQARQELAESALAELSGSWKRTVPVSDLLDEVVRLKPDSIAVGKISLESSYVGDAGDAGPSSHEPTQELEMLIAGRCFASPAEPVVFALLERLQSAPELAGSVQSISLEGLQKHESRENGLDAHAVFALRFALAPRVLLRQPGRHEP